MNKWIVSFIILLLAGTAVWAGEVHTLEEAKALAAKTNKPILMDFMTEW